MLMFLLLGLLLARAYSEDGKGEETLETEGHSFGSLGQATTFRQAGNYLQAAPTYGHSTYGQSAGLDRPQPFDFGYNVQDEFGNNQFRQEKGDESGSVQGAYGYTDAYGVYRKVHYVADQNGFRADIKTNEPGVKQENPADVQLVVEPPPQGVLQQALTGSRSAGFAKLPAAAPAQPRFPAGLHA
ncbi:cuticle protein 16.8-like [Dermacentor silvarum]|uniref:cuticle protein 16.8-like n=1 Tax=Dermacentor silvarum TaxID=543639 RepID=UPI0021007F23|nr:cuticle protein 16.8-like [Dermacentor silvarum]